MTPIGAGAQEASVERDPFSTPPIQETIQAADRDRVARITRDLVDARLVELELRIIRELESRLGAQTDRRLGETRDQVNQDIDARISAIGSAINALREEIPALIREEMAVTAPETEAGAGLPDGAAFVACVDGRALYRDSGGSTFYADDIQGGSGVSRCNN
jgi:hypothetical protein